MIWDAASEVVETRPVGEAFAVRPSCHRLGLKVMLAIFFGEGDGATGPLYNATPCFVMSTFAFVKRPFHWLQAISHHRGTHSQGPNFVYDLCVRRMNEEQRTQLDLSRWRNAGNGAEPINPRVLGAFCEAFGPSGFRRRAICPIYGLAEATLLVSSSPPSQDYVAAHLGPPAPENGRIGGEPAGIVVGCGRPLPSTEAVIVDHETRTRLGPGEVGEIWVASPAVALGFWQRPQETEETLCAPLADDGAGPFFRTRDIGFLRDGQVFVSGRLKDVIIIRGTNHYPQDIEWTAQGAHQSLRPENGAPFSMMVNGEEKLAIVQEVERSMCRASTPARSSRPSVGRSPSSTSSTCSPWPW